MRALLIPLLLLLVAAPGADAASLVHLDATGNVQLTSADGTVHRQVTADGTTDAPYAPPTADDAGVVLTYGHPDAFTARLLRQDGTDARGPWALPSSSCSAGPDRAAITPDGTRIAASWTDGRTACATDGDRLRHRRASPVPTTSILFGDAPTPLVHEPGAPLSSFDGRRSPRWITAPSPRLAAIRSDAIDVQESDAPDAPMRRWIGVPWWAADLDSFDVARAGDLALVEVSGDGHPAGGEDRRLVVLRVTGTPPAATVTHLCTAERLVADAVRPALPRWSPDGTMIAWTGAEGIEVSPAPVADEDGRCVLDPRLVAPGGTDAAWTAADITPDAPSPAPEEVPGRTTAPPSAVKRITGPPPVTPAARVVINVTLRSARTIHIRVERLPAAGRRGRARLVGVLKVAGKAGRNPVAVSKVGGKPLPNGRYRFTITAYRHLPRVAVVTLGR